LKPEEKIFNPPSTGTDIEAAPAEAVKTMTDSKNLLEQAGLKGLFITRCLNGAKWPVLMLEVGLNYAEIEVVRNGQW
jgi:hypothetical protein